MASPCLLVAITPVILPTSLPSLSAVSAKLLMASAPLPTTETVICPMSPVA